MKIKLLFLILFTSSISINSQQLYFEYSKTNSSFDYENSQGLGLLNILPKTNTNLAVGYRFSAIKDKLNIVLGLGYNSYGAIGSDFILDNYYDWDVSYVGFNAGFDYKIFSTRQLIFSIKANVSTEFLVQGNQTLNNQVFNLVGEEEFNQNLFFINGGLAVQYPISDKMSIYGQYMLGKSFTAFKETTIDNEQLNILSHGFGIGIIMKLSRIDCTF